ncbi:hypothetical protein [Paenibacillus sp. 2KB_22]|uniref:hypothetical protein n=1 Tax=Paenibacillus sp. 2KB_22 TaxID=3232978 RepID=UPI003F9A80DC
MTWIEGDTYEPNDFQMWMIAILEKLDWIGLPTDKWILKNIDLFPTRFANVIKIYEFQYIAVSDSVVNINVYVEIWESGIRIDAGFPDGAPQFDNDTLKSLLKQGENMRKYMYEAFQYFIEAEDILKKGFDSSNYRLEIDNTNLFSSLIR